MVVLASFFLSCAIGIKAGAILLLPAFLGTIQYRFGIAYLITSMAIILALQVAFAAPFLEYFGGKTSFETYLKFSKLLGGDADNTHAKGKGAVYEFSIYWKFLSEKTYNSPEFIVYTTRAIVFLNIWQFFVRKNAFPQCIRNLVVLTRPDSFSQ